MATKTVVAEMKIDFPYNDDRLRADEVNLRGNEDGRVFFNTNIYLIISNPVYGTNAFGMRMPSGV